MKWGDSVEFANLERSLSAVSKANETFETLANTTAIDELLEQLQELDANQLRSSVLARLLAERLRRP